MGLSWDDFSPSNWANDVAQGVTLGGYGALRDSNMMTNKNVPTQYQDRDQIMQLINGGLGAGGIAQQQAPQMAAAQAGPAAQMGAAQMQMGADPFRAAQLRQMQQLQGVASGQQMGAGELAARNAYGNALAAQQAQARMARGGNAALAYRNAANQSAALGSSLAGASQQSRIQDQMNAQGMLGGVANAGRGADINVAGQNAGFQQQANAQNAGFQQQTGLANAGFQQGANQYNAGLQQQNQQLNSQNYMNLLGQLTNMNANTLQGQQNVAMGANQNQANLLGGVLSAGGQLGGAMIKSDERLKKDVYDGRAEIDDLLESMRPKSYEYIDPKHGEGRRVGVMAQDMERSEAGRRIVRDESDGKALDVNKALSAALAGAARLHERLKKLEEQR